MDILHLIDRLEEELNRGRSMPLTSMVLVNQERVWSILDAMRVSIPDEVRKAQRTEQERDRILAKAEEEAKRVVDNAQKQAEKLTSHQELLRSAQDEATDIISQAQDEAERVQSGANKYALDVLAHLEEQLRSELQIVQNGIQTLTEQIRPESG
jgi:cell division septum initiation protein DivIVA